MNTMIRSLALGAASLSLLAAVGCTSQSNEGIKTGNLAVALAPKPADVSSERAQLSRYRGQTSFLNAVTWSFSRGGFPETASPMNDAKANKAESARAEQESDVFKVGKPGSKLLFLLNNYRGLQVVSYADGAYKPKLLGRVQPTGNSPDEMYYDENQDRLIVIENVYNYNDDEESYVSYRRASEPHSRLVMYDVSNPEKPAISGAIDLQGTVADSRIVGDVLYVATSQGEKGQVSSYSLKRKDLTQVDTRELNQRVSFAQNMNIVTVKTEAGYKYYLLATLSESGWGWWDRSSVIEIVDISDEKGQIKPVMSVAAKGRVSERSQTLIKNDTLIVTSNYTIDNSRNIARIAVETFRFPTKKSEILDENEATYRKLHIDRELKGFTGQAYEQALERLVNDPKLGLKGRFLQANNELRKMMPDSAVTVGDGSGLSANLQDVRYQDDFLYAFWVPANEIDPFDLFDISHPEEGVKYVSRLHFDGWIQRAIPMTVGGRRFILGLGWIVPVVNNESGRRQPQAMVFEVTQDHGKLRALDVAQLTFEGSNIWTNFNGQDKMIEVRLDGEGKGEVLFGASKYDQSGWDEGGQLLSFDLQAIVAGNYEGALKRGAFLSGGNDWIRRIFTNTEIGLINSFSDKSLATFGAKNGIDTATLAPVHMLELARNLRGYETLKAGTAMIGIQIVGDDSWYSQKSETELRAVRADKADSELQGVLGTLKVSGSYLDHLIDKNTGDLILMTSRYQNIKLDDGTYSYKNIVDLKRIGVSASGQLVERAGAQWNIERKEDGWMPMGLRIAKGFSGYGYDSNSLVQLQDGKILAQVDSTIKVVIVGADLYETDLQIQGCVTKDRHDVEVQVLGGKLYLASKESLESKEFEGLELARHYLAPAHINRQTLACDAEWNIPGRAMMVTATGEILADDTWVEDIVPAKKETPNTTEKSKDQDATPPTAAGPIMIEPIMPPHRWTSAHEVLSRNALVSLKVKEGKPALVDEQEKPESISGATALPNGMFVNLVPARGWGQSTHELQFVSLGEDGTLQSESYGFPMALGKHASISAIAQLPASAQGGFVALVRNGDKVQAITWKDDAKRPVVRKLAAVNERFEREDASELIRLPYNYGWGGQSAHFSPEALSFEVVQGMSGISQLFLEL